MLIGQYTSKLTDKDRISVPVKYREELGEELIIAKWYENSLVLVNKNNWEILIKRLIGAKGLIIEPVRDIDRFILGSAFELKLDKQGRLSLPEILIKFAQVKSEVVFVGLGDRVEIYSSENWREIEEGAQKKASEAVERIAKETR